MNGEVLFMTVLGGIFISLFGLFFGLLFKGIDRKIVARMQMRVGPPIRQPFLDVVKLMNKETVLPENAVPWMYHLAPIVCLVSSAILLLYIPIPGLEAIQLGMHGDIILVLYLFILSALAMVAGGFASGSPFATVGAQREMVTMMSYEFPLAVVIIGIVWKLWKLADEGTIAGDNKFFTLSFIASNPLWGYVGLLGFIGIIILLLALVVVTPGEVAKIPFDVAEAETEIAHGLLVEYSGRNLALFYLADGIRTFAMVSLVVALFFPYNISPIIEKYIALGDFAVVADFLFFLLKVFLVMLFSVTLVRAGMARLRITQVVSVYWITITLIALIGLVLLIWDSQFNIPLLR